MAGRPPNILRQNGSHRHDEPMDYGTLRTTVASWRVDLAIATVSQFSPPSDRRLSDMKPLQAEGSDCPMTSDKAGEEQANT